MCFKNGLSSCLGFGDQNGLIFLDFGIIPEKDVEFRAKKGLFIFGVVMVNDTEKTNAMIFNFFFSQLSLEKQVSYLQTKGVSLGTRVKDGRKIYVYMLRNLFVEVTYEDDDSTAQPEQSRVLRGLKNLNTHLEKEFRATF
jgi:hypothetical protein